MARKALRQFVVLLTLAHALLAQPAERAPNVDPPKRVGAPYDQRASHGPHHRIVTVQRTKTNALARVEQKTGQYIHLETGLHFWEDNQWKESVELIEKDGQGAIARHGQHKVRFAPNLNTAGAIDLETADGKRLRSHILGLSYYDAATGQSVLVAEVKDSVGEILPPNRIVYRDAFDGLQADVRYTWTKGGFEQDVIFKENPPGPDVFGLVPETTRLEVLTEFLNPPAPEKAQRVLIKEKDAERRRGMLEPDFIDETLRFGSMTMHRGQAFQAGEAFPKGDKPGDRPIPVAKRWQKFEGDRDFLVEAVEFNSVKDHLAKLPAAPAAVERPQQGASLLRVLPAARMARVTRPDQEVQLASRAYDDRGFVLDYIIVTEIYNFDFASGTTYLVTDTVNLYGVIQIHGGTVIKYESSDIIAFNGYVYCDTWTGNEAIITNMHDESYGESIPGSTGNPGAYQSSWGVFSTYGSGQYLHHLRIRYRNVGVAFTWGPPDWHTFSDSAVENALTAVQLYDAYANLWDLTLCNVGTVYYGYGDYNVNENGTNFSCGSDDHGNNTGSATSISPNGSVEGTLEASTDEDFFQVVIPVSGTVRAYTASSIDTYGYLLNAGGNQLTSDDDTGVGSNFDFSYTVNPGTYYVRVHYKAYGGTGPYTLHTEFSFTDSDSDGLPDSWEQQYFGGLSQGANGDPDNDGLTNLQEYQAGTNPIVFSIIDLFTPLKQLP